MGTFLIINTNLSVYLAQNLDGQYGQMRNCRCYSDQRVMNNTLPASSQYLEWMTGRFITSVHLEAIEGDRGYVGYISFGP